MPQAHVLVDLYRYHSKTGDPSSEILEAVKGDKIDVSAAELERGVDLGGLKAAGAKSGGDPWKDIEPAKMDAYVGAQPDGIADYPAEPKAKKADKVKALEAAGVSPDQVSDFEPTP